MKTKYLVLWGALAAFFVFGCKQEATEVIIVKGERIGAPKNVTVQWQNDPTFSHVMVNFTPSAAATSYRFFASNTSDRAIIYEVSPSSSSSPSWSVGGEYNYIIYELPKSGFKEGAFYSPPNTFGTSIYILGTLRYIGVANFSYHSTNIPSDITWVNVNSSAGSGSGSGYSPGYDNPGGGNNPIGEKPVQQP